MFSGDIKRKHWAVMGLSKKSIPQKILSKTFCSTSNFYKYWGYFDKTQQTLNQEKLILTHN